MIIKCKACGGDIQFQQGDTIGQCDHCGSSYTIPRVDEEQKLNRYNRANHFRLQGEFDKAIAAYERILEEDDTDAEAHWGVVLSRYGIEYVEDPATGKRIPTCHRVQVDSILADADYRAALEHATDTASRNLYEEQAKEIAEIQKGILAISQNEKPYDIFICYKESDENGQRTRDSALAQEIYYGLTEQGYKVFFSRITLEDKLGQQYEPYIFAALNSAKVMVVVGTKPEHFNAVWVRNEWSRFLHLMKSDRKRLLIPCYRDMDPYELPEELGNLQAQDMGRIGFMQDLLRGVKKVLDAESAQESVQKTETRKAEVPTANAAAPGVASLTERVKLFLEDGDFQSAQEYLNRILDIDPKYAPAYAAKLCVTLGLRKESDLAETTFLYEDNPDWQKAIRFADPQQKITYEGYISAVGERVQQQIRDYAYDCAIEMAVVPGADREKLDEELSALRQACSSSSGIHPDGTRRADSEQNEAALRNAVEQNEPGDMSGQNLEIAAEMLEKIGDTEAITAAEYCRQLAELARQKAEAELQAEETARQEKKSKKNKRKRKWRLGVIAFVVILAIVSIVLGLTIVPNNNRKQKLEKLKNDEGYVTFGTYPQTGSGTDQTPIEWLVLEYDEANHRVLLLSRYGLEPKPYNTEDVDITWENCTLRGWLNNQFLQTAFSEKERAGILKTTVDNSAGQGYSGWNTSGGDNTEDKIFLLSYAEVSQYLGDINGVDNIKARVAPTDYAIKNGAYSASNIKTDDGNSTGQWWLRSPGESTNTALFVHYNGSGHYCSVEYVGLVVRPAIWLDLDADIY